MGFLISAAFLRTFLLRKRVCMAVEAIGMLEGKEYRERRLG